MWACFPGGGSHDSSLTNRRMICNDWEEPAAYFINLNLSVFTHAAAAAFPAESGPAASKDFFFQNVVLVETRQAGTGQIWAF